MQILTGLAGGLCLGQTARPSTEDSTNWPFYSSGDVLYPLQRVPRIPKALSYPRAPPFSIEATGPIKLLEK